MHMSISQLPSTYNVTLVYLIFIDFCCYKVGIVLQEYQSEHIFSMRHITLLYESYIWSGLNTLENQKVLQYIIQSTP